MRNVICGLEPNCPRFPTAVGAYPHIVRTVLSRSEVLPRSQEMFGKRFTLAASASLIGASFLLAQAPPDRSTQGSTPANQKPAETPAASGTVPARRRRRRQFPVRKSRTDAGSGPPARLPGNRRLRRSRKVQTLARFQPAKVRLTQVPALSFRRHRFSRATPTTPRNRSRTRTTPSGPRPMTPSSSSRPARSISPRSTSADLRRSALPVRTSASSPISSSRITR